MGETRRFDNPLRGTCDARLAGARQMPRTHVLTFAATRALAQQTTLAWDHGNQEDCTPLMIAGASDGHVELVRVLVEQAGGRRGGEDVVRVTAYKEAEKQGHTEVVGCGCWRRQRSTRGLKLE